MRLEFINPDADAEDTSFEAVKLTDYSRWWNQPDELMAMPEHASFYFNAEIISIDDDPTDFYIEEVIYGNRASHVLSTLQYNPETLAQTMKANVDLQVKRGKIRPREGVDLTDFYENCLRSYTYLKK